MTTALDTVPCYSNVNLSSLSFHEMIVYLFIIVLEVNFERCDYSIVEGQSQRISIRLQFTDIQNSFKIILSPVTIYTAEDLGLGTFIASDDILDPFRASAGISIILYIKA